MTTSDHSSIFERAAFPVSFVQVWPKLVVFQMPVLPLAPLVPKSDTAA
jgi:hypothetical protein